MQYWTLVTRSFAIAWRHKYLWLLALFAGEAGGGFSFNSPSYPGNTQTGQSQNFRSFSESATSWLNSHVDLIVALAVALLVISIALFVLAAVCEGGVVRGAAEHDAERPFGLGWAWQAGRASMGTVIRIRLLLIALGLPVVIVWIVVVGAFLVALLGGSVGAVLGLGMVGVLLSLAAFVFFIYLDVLGRLSVRAAVLEQVASATSALGRGHRLVLTRFGRLCLVWLLALGVGFVIGIAAAAAALVITIPLVIAVVGAAVARSPALVLVIVLSVLILVPIFVVLGSFLAAQSSTYWTLAFRRLEIDTQPAVYPSAYPPPLSTPPPLPTPF